MIFLNTNILLLLRYVLYVRMDRAEVGRHVINFKIWDVKFGLLLQKNDFFWNVLLTFQK